MERSKSTQVPQPGTVVSPATAVQTDTPHAIAVDPALVQAVMAAVIAQVKPLVESAAAETANTVLSDFKKDRFGEKVVTFWHSAVGKSFQTFLWTAGAYILTVVATDVGNIHYGSKYIALGVPGLVNLVLYTVTKFVDNKVPNLPTAQK